MFGVHSMQEDILFYWVKNLQSTVKKAPKRKEAIYMYEYYDDIQYACRLYKVANKCQEFTRMAIKTLEQKYNLR